MARRSTAALRLENMDLAALIAERAYFKSERRGFVPGYELDDWLAAERELNAPAAPKVVKPKRTPARRKNGAAKKR